MINIIGGHKKRTKIVIPSNNVRPTSAKKREAIFSIIDSYQKKISYNIYEKKNILDLFAGSGALGLEAISRGGHFAYFYEKNTNVIKYLKNNCERVCKEKNFKIKKIDILKNNFKDISRKISLIFIDPPYKINPFEKILHRINESNILAKNAVIVLEYSQNSIFQIPNFFNCIKQKRYRNTNICFLAKKI